jgi:hypothetical protein
MSRQTGMEVGASQNRRCVRLISIGINTGGNIMHKESLMVLMVLGCSLVGNLSPGQVANTSLAPPATKLESFDTNLSSVIIRATTEIGTVSVNTGIVSVRCREITDTGSGRKEQGIAMEITQRDVPRDTVLIDYDEIAPLLSAIDYLNQVDFSVTALNAFDATYTTRGGFRVAAFGTRRNSAIQFAVRDARTNSTPVIFLRTDMSQFGGLIDQAKKKLDSVRGG